MVTQWRIWGSVLLCVLCPLLVSAQVAGVDISVTPRQGAIDTAFELVVAVDPSVVESRPELTESDDFALVGTSTRTQTFITNGRVNTQYSYSYSLLPQRSGKLSLPNILLEHNSKTVSLAAGTVEVSDSDSTAQLLENKELLFQQSVSTLTAYQGQQIRNTFEVVSNEPFRDLEFPAPAFPGFWVEAQLRDSSGSRMQGNKRVFYFETSRSLYPVASGNLTLSEKEIALKVRDSSKSTHSLMPQGFPFTFMETREPKQVTLRSNPLEIEVLPLPTAPADSTFWSEESLVGNTRMTVQFDRSSIQAGESKTVHVTILTLGNANPIKKLPLESNDSYRIYQEAPQIGYRTEQGLLRMQLTLSASIVPRKSGVIEIPPLVLTYFSAEHKEYKTIRSQALTFTVKGTMNDDAKEAPLPTTAEAAPSAAEPDQTSGTEQLPVYKPATILDKVLETISPGLLLLFVCSLLLFSVVLWLALPLMRAKRYIKKLHGRVQKASSPTELALIFDEHIKKMTGIKAKAFKKSELANELAHFVQNKSLLFAIQSFLDTLDQAAFGADSRADTAQLRSELQIIVDAWQ